MKFPIILPWAVCFPVLIEFVFSPSAQPLHKMLKLYLKWKSILCEPMWNTRIFKEVDLNSGYLSTMLDKPASSLKRFISVHEPALCWRAWNVYGWRCSSARNPELRCMFYPLYPRGIAQACPDKLHKKWLSLVIKLPSQNLILFDLYRIQFVLRT